MTDGVPGPGDDLPQRGAAVVRSATDLVPQVAVVLGSGLGPALGDELRATASLPYTDLPGFPPTAVPGHAGRLILGTLSGVRVAAFSGRVHYYEGHSMDVPALLPRLAHALGARTLVLTAAVGGLEPGVDAGTVVVLTRPREHDGGGAAPRLALPGRHAGVRQHAGRLRSLPRGPGARTRRRRSGSGPRSASMPR